VSIRVYVVGVVHTARVIPWPAIHLATQVGRLTTLVVHVVLSVTVTVVIPTAVVDGVLTAQPQLQAAYVTQEAAPAQITARARTIGMISLRSVTTLTHLLNLL